MKLFSGLTDRLRAGLRRSQEYLTSGLTAVLDPERPIDEQLYEELEEVLIASDLGAAVAADFVNRAREEVMFGTVTRADQLRPLFRRFLADTLAPAAVDLALDHRTIVRPSCSCSA
jgi:fused signal recognition particle receptor